MKKLLLFDLDLTLVDSNKSGVYAYKKVFTEYGLKIPRVNELKNRFGMDARDLIHFFYPELGDENLEKVHCELQRILLEDSDKYVKGYLGVKNALKKLSKMYELGVVSNASHERIICYLDRAGYDLRMFEVFVGNDDVKRSKPWPDEIFKAEKLVKMNANFMVGDSIFDMMAAKRSKTRAIGVLTGNTSKYKLKKYGAWKVVNSVADLPKLL